MQCNDPDLHTTLEMVDKDNTQTIVSQSSKIKFHTLKKKTKYGIYSTLNIEVFEVALQLINAT